MKQFALKILLSFCFCLLLQNAQSQIITTGPDSAVVKVIQDPIPLDGKGLSAPEKAALFSAILPGLGQAYNKSYWKIPLIYAAGGVVGYVLYDNHHKYLGFRGAIDRRLLAAKDEQVQDDYTARLGNLPKEDQLNRLRRARDFHRRWRDYNIVYSILTYGLNITEAYVHAHLKGFDVSEELSLQVHPDLIRTTATKYTPGLTLSFNLKK